MIKFLAITLIVAQALAAPAPEPGFGFGMNPWFSQFGAGAPWLAGNPWFGGQAAGASPLAGPWGGNPWLGNPAFAARTPLAAPDASAAPAAPAAPALPLAASIYPTMGKGLGAFHKQLGFAQAIFGVKAKSAQDDIKLRLDALKNAAALNPNPACATQVQTVTSGIENQLLVAFEPCQMKDEFSQMRLQGLAMKQQAAALKMATKACKGSLDPVTCITEASAGAVAPPPPATNLVDLNQASDQCIADASSVLIKQIDDATNDLATCV